MSGKARPEPTPHTPVLLEEVMSFFAPTAGQLYLDGNLGFGGHSGGILAAGASVIGVDLDPSALESAKRRLADHGERFSCFHGNASDFPSFINQPPPALDGILLDLGVSSWQLDRPERGFSFQADGPLDMRMNPEASVTAAVLVNERSEEDMADLLWRFGEERASRKIAAEIVRRRARAPLTTTKQLAELIARVVPRSGGAHPATRSFQALRIAVNDELGSLERTLQLAAAWLRPGGKLAVITFHSLEDRIVKTFLRERGREWLDDPTWPAPRRNLRRHFDVPRPASLTPSAKELAKNPRSRSARLRLAIRNDMP